MKKKIFLSVAFGIVAFIIAWSLGTVLNITTGIPLIGGLLNGVITAMVLVIGIVSTRYFGSSIVMWLVFSIIATPTTTLGPPGFYKIIIALIAGLIWDSIYYLSKFKKWGLYIGGLLGSASIMFTLVGALQIGFGEDAAIALKKYESAFWMILLINLIVTYVGLLLGNVIYNSRLKKLKAFQNMDS